MSCLACRNCGSRSLRPVLDLGVSPLANSYVRLDEIERMEPFYPLNTVVCEQCHLMQLGFTVDPKEVFSTYAYFSGYSSLWRDHCARFAGAAAERFKLGPDSRVVEIASNDGTLLLNFRERGIPVLGIEPAANIAAVAEKAGVPTLVEFFGTALVPKLGEAFGPADLIVANNVMAHVPTLHDFVGGVAAALAENGVFSVEFPHVKNLLEETQFDTIYHEHVFYLSLFVLVDVCAKHGLEVFDVEAVETHGGSLRVFAARKGSAVAQAQGRPSRVESMLRAEVESGLQRAERYADFARRSVGVKMEALKFLIACRERGERVVGYGAPAKGNTFLNFCGVGPELIDYVVDRNPAKQNTLLPGSRISVFAPEKVFETRPDYLLILPWNIAPEVRSDLAGIAGWGGRFVTAIPRLEVLE